MKSLLLLLMVWACMPVFAQTPDNLPFSNSVVINHIYLFGNKKTRDEIILRELSVKEGQTLTADSISAAMKLDSLRLATVGLFTYINVHIDTVSNTQINWIIQVKERWFVIPEPIFQLADRNFNVWWNEQNRDIRRVIIGTTIRHKNFRGNLENLIATVQVGYTKKFGLEYLKPYIDKEQKHGFGIAFSVAESQETFYTTDSNKLKFVRSEDNYIIRQYEFSAAYTWRPAYATRHIFRLGYRNYHIEDTIAKLNPDYFNDQSHELNILEISYRLERNKTDNWNYPLRGTKMIGQAIARVGLQGMKHQFVTTLELGKYWHAGRSWYVSGTFRGKVSFPEEQPYALRAALGGKFDYVRGYEYYVVDGPHFGLLRANLKKEILNVMINKTGIRYLPVIPVRIYPKIFADAGCVYNPQAGNSFLNNRMLYSYGVGLDIFTFYDIKIRLEYAFNHLGQKDLFLHFNSE